MLKIVLYSSLAGVALTAALAPSLVRAQASCQEQKHDNRVVGTVLGGVAGALLGNAIGEHGGREGGTIIGGVGGAVAGNAIGAATVNCSNRYGRYDETGRWIPNTATEYGYYDANGRWVDTTARAYDAQPPAGPAYGRNDAYSPPPPPGAYGQDSGAYGREGAAYPPPAPPPGGYGETRPYGQDGGYAPPPPPGVYDRDRSYDRGVWAGAPGDTRAREDWLQDRIQHRIADGELDDRRGRHALRELDDIRRIDSDYRDPEGRLDPDQRRDILARLDALRESVWTDRADARDGD